MPLKPLVPAPELSLVDDVLGSELSEQRSLHVRMETRPTLLRSRDPNTSVHRRSPQEILDRYGMPSYLLGSSTKVAKSGSVGVLARIMYLTPGVFCGAADTGCLLACLGHNSGRMGMRDSFRARDKRTAFYLAHPEAFVARLQAELHLLRADSLLKHAVPAARLNGSSDIAWERKHPELFQTFPSIRFFDYSKILPRVLHSLGAGRSCTEWPANYHLVYSASEREDFNQRVLDAGGTVATVFWPNVPQLWKGFPVLDGDRHDARFLDEPGSVVGLSAKGIAQVDVTGFTRRPCPSCGPERELEFVSAQRDATHIQTRHECSDCKFELAAKVIDPYRNRALEQATEDLSRRRADASYGRGYGR